MTFTLFVVHLFSQEFGRAPSREKKKRGKKKVRTVQYMEKESFSLVVVSVFVVHQECSTDAVQNARNGSFYQG